jgi:hypothetical protein
MPKKENEQPNQLTLKYQLSKKLKKYIFFSLLT